MRAKVWRENHTVAGVHSWDVDESGLVILKDAKHNVIALVTSGAVVEFVEDTLEKPVEVPIVRTVG